MEKIFVEIFASVFEAVLIYYWIKVFSKTADKNKWMVLIKMVAASCIIWCSFVFFTDPMLRISCTAIACMGMAWLNRITLRISIVITVIFCVMMALCDVLGTYIVMFFSNQPLENMRLISKYAFISNIVIKFLLLFCVSLVYMFKKTDYRDIRIGRIVYLLLMPLGSIVILYLMIEEDVVTQTNMMLALFAITALFIGNIYTFSFFEKEELIERQKMRELFLKQQIENERLYYQNLQTTESEIRQIRHDLKNTLAALGGYIKAGDTEKAMRYIEEKNEELTGFKNISGHLAIDALINAKYTKAVRNKIAFNMFIALEQQLGMDEMDICIILGNALDNAIEACQKVEKGQILLSMRQREDTLLITIKNTIETQKAHLSFTEKRTTKEDKADHGFGLSAIKRLTDKYDGNIDYQSENGWIALMITLNLKSSVNSIK